MEVLDESSRIVSHAGLTERERAYWVAFNRINGIGPMHFRLLLTYFHDDLAFAWQANSQELISAGMYQKTIDRFLMQRSAIEPERELERLAREEIELLTWRDAAYPALLREIEASPPVLYTRGKLTEADKFALGVVGTRNSSSYGQQATERLVGELARGQVTIC